MSSALPSSSVLRYELEQLGGLRRRRAWERAGAGSEGGDRGQVGSLLREGWGQNLFPLGTDPGGRAGVEPGVEEHPGRRCHLRQPARRRYRHALPGKASRGEASERLQRIGGAVEHGNRDRAKDLAPPLPVAQLHEVVRTHQPDETQPRKAAAQRLQGVGGVVRTASRLSRSLTTMRLCPAATRRACSSRTAKGAMPATGFNGFCGETSHHTSSRSRRSRASRLKCR